MNISKKYKEIYNDQFFKDKKCFLTFNLFNLDKTIINVLKVTPESGLGLNVVMIHKGIDMSKVCLEIDFDNYLDDKELLIDLSSIKDSDLEAYVDNYLDNTKCMIKLTKKELFKFRLDDIWEHRKDLLKKVYLEVSVQIEIFVGKYAFISATIKKKEDDE